MYVCLCSAVTDAAIARAARAAGTLDRDQLESHLETTLGVGSCCGRCRGTALAIAEEAQSCAGACVGCPRPLLEIAEPA